MNVVDAHGRRPWHRLAALALVALIAGACTSSPTADTGVSVAAGSPWAGAFAAVALPAPVNSLTGVACPTESACWAVGSTVGGAGIPNGAVVIATTNGGATWKPQVIPPAAGYLSSIACADQHDCVAVGQAAQASNGQAVILATTDGGRAWQSRPVPPGLLDITTVSCSTDHQCIAVGDVAGGAVALSAASPTATWLQRGALPPAVDGATDVSCTDALHCWVTARRSPDVDHVAGLVALTTDGGSSWTALVSPPGVGYLTGIACRTASGGSSALPYGSTAPAGSAAVTTPGSAPTPTTSGGPPTPGATGSAPPTSAPPSSAPPTSAPPVGVPGAHCALVGTTSTTLGATRSGHGVILTTTNGGASWSGQPVPASVATLMDVTCTAVNSCVVVGSSVASSAQAGTVILSGPADSPWKSAAQVGASQPLTAVSCPSQSHCVVVGESISEHLVGS